jgi:hypothetical protein
MPSNISRKPIADNLRSANSVSKTLVGATAGGAPGVLLAVSEHGMSLQQEPNGGQASAASARDPRARQSDRPVGKDGS